MSLNRVQIEKLKSLPWLDEIVARQPLPVFLPFEEARTYVRSLGLKSCREWELWRTQRPLNIPSGPCETYKDEWISWRDWLGTSKRTFLPFEEARTYVRSLGLKSDADWRVWAKSDARPRDIPASPADVYQDEFLGIKDWLGYMFWPFEEARVYVRSLGLKTQAEYRAWVKSARPQYIPTHPETVYKDEWVCWRDWLGTEFRPFVQAREFVRSLGLKSRKEWRVWSKTQRPTGIPTNPNVIYASEWISLEDWLRG